MNDQTIHIHTDHGPADNFHTVEIGPDLMVMKDFQEFVTRDGFKAEAGLHPTLGFWLVVVHTDPS